jgi:hypothetical protein
MELGAGTYRSERRPTVERLPSSGLFWLEPSLIISYYLAPRTPVVIWEALKTLPQARSKAPMDPDRQNKENIHVRDIRDHLYPH